MGVSLSNTVEERRKSPFPVIIAIIFLVAGGIVIWQVYANRQKAKLAEEEAYKRRSAEIERREAAEREKMLKKQNEKPKPVVEEEEEPAPVIVKPKEKTLAELLQEEEAERKKVLAQVEEARKASAGKTLTGFAGVRFDEPYTNGVTSAWGTIQDKGDTVDARGVAFAVYAHDLKKPFMSLGTSPLVWLTPKTRFPYRIEFKRKIKFAAGGKHDADTTNIVAFIAKRFKQEPFAVRPLRPKRSGCEYVIPLGDSTISVTELDGILSFSVEREDVKNTALKESQTVHAEKLEASEDSNILDSTRYPHRPIERNKYPKVKFKDETPRSFCGIVFASQPPETATIVNPQHGEKGFYLDYSKTKCRPFFGFTVGKADIDVKRGGVWGVTFSSEGGAEGLDDKDYYNAVRKALEEHYKVKAVEKKQEGMFDELTFQIGDLTVVFGPDARGGFIMRAENQVLKKMAKGS